MKSQKHNLKLQLESGRHTLHMLLKVRQNQVHLYKWQYKNSRCTTPSENLRGNESCTKRGIYHNKANLRGLIAATGLVILLKLDSNRRFFSPCDHEIRWMTPKNNRVLHQALCIISNPSVNSNWSYSPETLSASQNWRFFVPCDLEIWRMTLKNNKAPLQCHCKLVAPFHSHWWIQTGVTVRQRII